MQKDRFEQILNFLLGASWAIAFFGVLVTFKQFLVFGVTTAIFMAIVFLIISLFFILLLDSFSVNKQRLEEAKKQTALLEKIYSKHTK
jgi:uncharacterized membrane protein